MRLVCPNCDAEYEVDDAAIPRDGRDVQCSNCGHAWFQGHPEIEAERQAEADLYDPPPGAVAEPVEPVAPVAPQPVATPVVAEAAERDLGAVSPPESAPEPASAPEPEDEDEPDSMMAVVAAAPKARSLDETVLAVLKEEAEREAASRRAEAASPPALESQTEMPMAAPQDQGGMAAAVRRIAQMRNQAAVRSPAPEPAPAHKHRGQLFPAIEEINSTLRSAGGRGQGDAIVDSLPDLTAPRGGSRRGFLMLVVLAVLIVALYVLAPLIGQRVPALADAATAYVAAVDAARVWLDVNLRALVAMLRGLAGGQGG